MEFSVGSSRIRQPRLLDWTGDRYLVLSDSQAPTSFSSYSSLRPRQGQTGWHWRRSQQPPNERITNEERVTNLLRATSFFFLPAHTLAFCQLRAYIPDHKTDILPPLDRTDEPDERDCREEGIILYCYCAGERRSWLLVELIDWEGR